MCHSPVFSLPLGHSLHEVNFSLAAGEMGDGGSQCLFSQLMTVILKTANIAQAPAMYSGKNYFRAPNELIYIYKSI